MAFDFDKAEKVAATEPARPVPNIAAIVLGQSSSGKSFLAGTMPGKTLFLFTQGEEHGKDSAKLSAGSSGSQLVPVEIDLERNAETGEAKVLGPDSTYKRLLSILRDGAGMAKAGFSNVAIDGLTELEQLVRGTSEWTLKCKTKDGSHNKFAEPDATIATLRPIFDALRALQRDYGLNYMVTCILMVKAVDELGEILASEPKLMGYEVAAQLIPQFPDQIMVGRMVNPKTGEEAHRLQFTAKASKTVRDDKTKEIKKLIGFTPRLRGVTSEKLPATMAADLTEVLNLKGGK